MEQLYLGIDGGGTKTIFVICDEEGNILSEFHEGSADYRQIGIEGLKKLLSDGLKGLKGKLEKKGHLSFEENGDISGLIHRLEGICIGVPNYTEVAAMDTLVDMQARTLFPADRVHIVNDSEVGWAGSLGMQPGINLVSGTGSISFGKNEQGKTATAGGWSDFFSDEGSCHWLGVKCLELFSKEADGRIPRGDLYRTVREHFGLKEDKGIIQVVDTVYRQHRSAIASLQRLLAEAARNSDPAALEAYEAAADELIMIVKATARALEMGSGTRVTCSGGLFNRRSPILPIMKRKLEENRMIWVQPQFPPHLGAVLLAARYRGRTDTVERMKERWEHVFNGT